MLAHDKAATKAKEVIVESECDIAGIKARLAAFLEHDDEDLRRWDIFITNHLAKAMKAVAALQNHLHRADVVLCARRHELLMAKGTK